MPTYNITLTGDVQGVGLRHLIAELGTQQRRRGLVFNEADGTVRVVVSGTREQVDAFIDEIRTRSASLPAEIESAEAEAVNGEVSLPPFVAPPTDDLSDISRKLGIGIRTLDRIEESTDRLSRIEESTDRLSRIEESTDQVLENTHKLVDGQERMIEILDERL